MLGFAGLDAAGRELSGLADACVEAALRSLEPTLPFAGIAKTAINMFGGFAVTQRMLSIFQK